MSGGQGTYTRKGVQEETSQLGKRLSRRYRTKVRDDLFKHRQKPNEKPPPKPKHPQKKKPPNKKGKGHNLKGKNGKGGKSSKAGQKRKNGRIRSPIIVKGNEFITGGATRGWRNTNSTTTHMGERTGGHANPDQKKSCVPGYQYSGGKALGVRKESGRDSRRKGTGGDQGNVLANGTRRL